MSKTTPKNIDRLKMFFLFISLLFLYLIGRLGYWQIIRGDELRKEALAFQTRDIEIQAKRGTIYDRNGKELAISVDKYRIWVNPQSIVKKPEKFEQAVDFLAETLEMDEDELTNRINESQNKKAISVKRWISEEEKNKIYEVKKEKKYPGIWATRDVKRIYPYANFASYVIGHVSSDNEGQAGIELEYNNKLKGLPGRMVTITDNRGREIYYGKGRYNEPVDGTGIVLTVDEVIQYYLERALGKAVVENQAKRAFGIVMDPKTGDILAMAAKPDYNLNDPREPIFDHFKEMFASYPQEDIVKAWYQMWRNPLVNDAYEPGSTFKPVTACAALEEGLTYMGEMFDIKGYTMVGKKMIKDWIYPRSRGLQTLEQGVENSYNSVFIELGQRLGVRGLYEYIDAFGLTGYTGIDLPGEAIGNYYPEKNVGPVELATISFGQANSVTPIQLITAISAIANDGTLLKPRMVKEYVDSNMNIVERFEPVEKRQVVSAQTARLMRDMMESEVVNGGGKNAYIEGYRVGGKTGTAQKSMGKAGYAKGVYVSSFVGLAPSDDPRLVILIGVDEPSAGKIYGSAVAAPVAREVLYDSLRYLDVKPDTQGETINRMAVNDIELPDVRNMTYKDAYYNIVRIGLQVAVEPPIAVSDDDIVVDMFPKPYESVPLNSQVVFYVKKRNIEEQQKIVVPDLRGRTIRDVANIVSSMDLQLKALGNGISFSQKPEPGTEVSTGTSIIVEFMDKSKGYAVTNEVAPADIGDGHTRDGDMGAAESQPVSPESGGQAENNQDENIQN